MKITVVPVRSIAGTNFLRELLINEAVPAITFAPMSALSSSKEVNPATESTVIISNRPEFTIYSRIAIASVPEFG